MAEKTNYYGEDFSELRITSALNWSIYRNMSEDEVLEFIKKDAKEKIDKFVNPEWNDAVHVICIYTVLDGSYNQVEKVIAKLVYAHELGIEGKITSIEKC